MSIAIIPAYNYPKEISMLFKEYTDMLIEEDCIGRIMTENLQDVLE